MNDVRLVATASLLLFLLPAISRASLVYNYGQDYLYDSNTRLYWQIASVPTSTFTPVGAARVATLGQVDALLAYNLGYPSNGGYSLPAAYSADAANLASFFSSDASAQTNPPAPISSTGLSGIGYVFGGAISDAPANPRAFDGLTIVYNGASVISSDWVIGGAATVDLYVPGTSIPTDAWFCSSSPCPTETNAFLVSTTAPAVPLPGSGMLMLSALTGLGVLFGRRKSRALMSYAAPARASASAPLISYAAPC
jgi:hypothetical protein